jgi:hypothetical protein
MMKTSTRDDDDDDDDDDETKKKKECERRTSFQSLAIFSVAGDRFSLREQVPRVESDSSQREWNDDDDVS